MLKTFLTECNDCVDLSDLLCQIDSRILYYTKNKINNITLLASLPYDSEVIGDLLKYKQILTHRMFNPGYAPDFSLQTIISRVKILLNK